MATGSVSWLEFGPPVVTGSVSWLEFGAPLVSGSVSWIEFWPQIVTGSVSWLEFGNPPITGSVSWLEFGVPPPPPAAYVLECLPGYFQSQGAPALADFEMDLGVGSFSSSGQEVQMAQGGQLFQLSATPIGKRLSLSVRPPNVSTRTR